VLDGVKAGMIVTLMMLAMLGIGRHNPALGAVGRAGNHCGRALCRQFGATSYCLLRG